MAHLLVPEGRERRDVVRFGLDKLSDPTIAQAVVMLRFTKSGSDMGGNGFFINIPGQDRAIILTAGHNLIDETGNRTTRLKAWWRGTTKWADIAENDIRISSKYLQKPTSESAIDDFGIISLSKNNDPPPPTTAFGFSLRLDEEIRIDGQCNISSYLTGTTQGDMPTRSTGSFVNPFIREDQLEYLVTTEAGMSGSAVWVGYNGKPVVVAVHNYGPKRIGPRYGSLGSRINMKMMQEILEWTGVYKQAVNIIAQPPPNNKRKPPKYPLCMIWSEQDKIVRVNVKDDSEPTTKESIFEVLPVISPAILEGKKEWEEFGFSQPDNRPGAKNGARRWISWNVEKSTVTFTDTLGSSRRASWQPFKDKTARITLRWDGRIWDVAIRTDEEVIPTWDLELPGVEYTGVAYQPRSGSNFQDSYTRFILQDA
ncbi:hypothetical protein F5B19DRAFT_333137 [Rostrohypoxylon terebratum]|nr:hypothetical protein F5B19DRAFT_333137 [Rostrohypoxylon terebratum]